MVADIRVIIPAYNEQRSVGKVLEGIPAGLISEAIVVNNASTDRTREAAELAGATVLEESRMGYGNACLKGLDYLTGKDPDVVVFMDADYSDHPEEMPLLTEPILNDRADLVIGSRVRGNRESGSLTLPQRFGNWLATMLLRWFYGVSYTDLGPFRAIRYSSLKKMKMEDRTYGWTVEMQLKAAKHGLRCLEVPVSYRKRIGKSKISGTIKGTVLAGHKIIWTLIKYR